MSLTEGVWNALHVAALMGHAEVVDYLLNKSSNLGGTTNGYGDIPLEVAARHGPPNLAGGVLKLFLQGRYVASETAIHKAAAANNGPAMEYLLACDNPSIQKVASRDAHYDRTPLWYAAATGSKDAAKVLLEDGADAEAADIFGRTPLHIACLEGHSAIVKMLLDAGASTDRPTTAPMRMGGLRRAILPPWGETRRP